MAQVDYDKILELLDGTAVDFVSENPHETRFKYSCIIHMDNAADPIWQYDAQGKARDGQYIDVRNALEYTISQVWTKGEIEPGLTTREPVDRPLEDFEYMIVTRVDLAADIVSVVVTQGSS